MLTEELFNKWISALRSGEYKQDKNHLKTDNGYCCLGVLADIKGVEWNRFDEDSYYFKSDNECYYYNLDKDHVMYSQILPMSVLHINIQNTLSNMNDDGYSFLEIADYLVENKHLYVKNSD